MFLEVEASGGPGRFELVHPGNRHPEPLDEPAYGAAIGSPAERDTFDVQPSEKLGHALVQRLDRLDACFEDGSRRREHRIAGLAAPWVDGQDRPVRAQGRGVRTITIGIPPTCG
jgi:hypothetical protein